MRVGMRFVGRVQGVGFRATTRSIARGFVVVGWVRNEHDGSVLLEAEGSPEQVEAFLADLHQRLGRNIENIHRSELPERPPSEQGGDREKEFVIQR